ncbi:hypothetical protein A9259_08050 [Vibrio cyclitrophicus]|uniref:hypothetical protein n=1 Tax=Vibrio cyclitrophicus TaxID=47951 RepID=UPI0007EEDD9C|nr:hypothetical protein [Vibrio cyclitrophicus]OBS98817.1 hypothetical protein A9259_08050 [Vibrio cyclitrophicus]
MAENGPREDIAKIVSEKLLSFFKWDQFGPYDQDFDCRREDKHKKEGKNQQHTHPVDVVWGYKDPYLNKTIYLNTDLKSYGEGSINPKSIETALTSLARTIECAENSDQWQNKYVLSTGDFEVRALLFVYNHDNKQQKEFWNFFYPGKREKGQKGPTITPVNLSDIPVPKGKQLHIIEPKLINYLMSITADINEMVRLEQFPTDDYGFYYPDLTYHKVLSSEPYLPATIEMLSSPFMIIQHDDVYHYDRKAKEDTKVFDAGFVVYYNREGKSDNEFIYLLDILSKYQILSGKNNIRIRVLQQNASSSASSHFSRALRKYSHEWGYDDATQNELFNRVKLDLIPYSREFYSSENIGWKC